MNKMSHLKLFSGLSRPKLYLKKKQLITGTIFADAAVCEYITFVVVCCGFTLYLGRAVSSFR